MSKNEAQKKDLRVTRTQKALSTAMLKLLEKTSFSKISVNDICTEAMVGRATFYTHFEDKYHLLQVALRQMMEELVDNLEVQDLEHFVHKVVDHLAENRTLFRNLLLRETNQELIRMLNTQMMQSIRQTLEQRQDAGEIMPAPAELLAVFFAGGAAQLMIWWIDTDMQMSREEVARFLLLLIGRAGPLDRPRF